MENVVFFDWKLDLEHPLSWHISQNRSSGGVQPPDAHSAIHLLIIIEGSIIAQYVQSTLKIDAGELFITSPWEVHRSINTHERKLLFINIDPAALQKFFFCGYENLEKLFTMLPAERKKCLNVRHDLKEECQKILQIFNQPDTPGKSLEMWHAVLGLFMKIKIEENIPAGQSRNLAKLRPALQKLSGKFLSAAEAAEECNLSSSYFAALFKKTFGLSFARYERMFRLNKASADIARGSSLKEAADAWGFCDKSHLAKLLKAYKK